METKLNSIALKARREKGHKFSNLVYLVNKENLKSSFCRLKADRASGIDGVTVQEYEKDLDGNIERLIDLMKRQAYKPQAVRRTYIPKANGKMRPLGIPTVEDKMVQHCVTRILEAIWEADFIGTSYGFRRGRNCHRALAAVNNIITKKPVSYVIDADIKGFFDNVDHDWMMKCLEQRIADTDLLRLIKRFLISGYMEEGKYHDSEKGTPQGGVISPMLANIYLHYVLDLWFAKVVKKECKGYVELVRYADDFVICVQLKSEADAILAMLRDRLGKFSLELAEDKTRIVEFGRFAKERSGKGSGGKPGTFNFLGFTHFCSLSKSGRFKVGRTTDRKKLDMKLKDMLAWLKKIRCRVPIKEWWPILCMKLKGHFQYYGVSENSRGISAFRYLVLKLVFKWLNRRSQKKSMRWDQFNIYCKRHGIPPARLYVNFYSEPLSFEGIGG